MTTSPFKKIIEHLHYLAKMIVCTYSITRTIHLRNVKKKKHINVVFFASNVSMWRYQHLYELMSKHERFNVYVLLSPFLTYSKEEKDKDINELKEYFDAKKVKYIEANSCNIEKDIDPDILFYPQYYFNILKKEHDAKRFRNRLLCAYPYSFNSIYSSFFYDKAFHNAAWKLFYPTQSILNEAKRFAFNKARNAVVTGYPNADDFLSPQVTDVWKHQPKKKKRIVWASHFTIKQGISPLHCSTFLEFSALMQNLAIKYADTIQFAFKPHPRLLTELYKHKDWGKKKANEYYSWWDSQINTQLETGSFIDLFKTSDAMIHDCASFSIEYFYTKKPAMYLSHDIEEIKKTKNEVGKAAIDVHYIGKTEEDIVKFIEDVVLKDNDPMKEQRDDFFNKNLLPPNGKTVAQNTMDEILKSLDIK